LGLLADGLHKDVGAVEQGQKVYSTTNQDAITVIIDGVLQWDKQHGNVELNNSRTRHESREFNRISQRAGNPDP